VDNWPSTFLSNIKKDPKFLEKSFGHFISLFFVTLDILTSFLVLMKTKTKIVLIQPAACLDSECNIVETFLKKELGAILPIFKFKLEKVEVEDMLVIAKILNSKSAELLDSISFDLSNPENPLLTEMEDEKKKI